MIETNDVETFKIKLKLLLNKRVLFSKKYPLVKSGELIHNLTHFKLKISYYKLDCDYFSIKISILNGFQTQKLINILFQNYFSKV